MKRYIAPLYNNYYKNDIMSVRELGGTTRDIGTAQSKSKVPYILNTAFLLNRTNIPFSYSLCRTVWFLTHTHRHTNIYQHACMFTLDNVCICWITPNRLDEWRKLRNESERKGEVKKMRRWQGGVWKKWGVIKRMKKIKKEGEEVSNKYFQLPINKRSWEY